MVECELCRVVRRRGDDEFARIYGADQTRTIRATTEVVVMPSLGSLGALHALVLPFRHVRSTATAPSALRRSLWGCVTSLREALAECGSATVVLEHGLPPQGGRSCGIDHAHIHVVEVAADQALQPPPGLWTEHYCRPEDVAVDPQREHLLVGLPSGGWLLRHEEGVESQFLRRWLAQELGREDWDWRTADPDQALPVQTRRLRELLPLDQIATSA